MLVAITGITILLNALFAKRYRNENQHELVFYKLKTIGWLAIILLALNVIAYLKLDHPWGLFLLFQVLLIAVGFLFVRFGDGLAEYARKRIKYSGTSWNYVHSFSLMALTRLIITSGIPVVLFYVASYNYEQNLIIRYKQFDFANNLLEKDPTVDPRFMSAINSNNNQTSIYKDSAWISDVRLTNLKPEFEYTEEDSLTVNLLNLFRFYKSNRAISEENFHLSHANDSSFFYNHLLKEASRNNNGTITYKMTNVPGQYLQLRSVDLNYQIPQLLKNRGVIFWSALVIALFGFYFLILSIIKKLFATDLPDLASWNGMDDEIVTNKRLNGLLFILGLPGAGKLKSIIKRIERGELFYDEQTPYIYNSRTPYRDNVLVVDMILIADSPNESSAAWEKITSKGLGKDHIYKLIIVNHFEYNIQDAVTNRIKLNYLEQLMLENRSKVIILSTIHPTAFLDSFNEQQLDQKKDEAILHDLERWHVLFGHYRIVIVPLDQDMSINADQPAWERTIKRETQFTHFLNAMQPVALKVAESMADEIKAESSDLLALKLQGSAHYFYMYIWQSLTREEKFLLYDLAEDGLVNTFDDYNLTMLINKGVIIRHDGMLKLFNKGFRNFILTAIGNTEMAKIKTQIRDNGNWRKLRTPLLLILIAILTFLFTSQNEAYSKLITYVTALTAGIPAVIKLLSMFDKTPQKNT